MARMGMDVDFVEQAGRDLQSKASAIDSVVAGVDKAVNSLRGVWDGRDADTFVNEWWPEHKKALAAASQSVAGLGQSALNNASEQRQASGANGSGGAGAGGGGSNTQVLPPMTPKARIAFDTVAPAGVTAIGFITDGQDYLKALANGGHLASAGQSLSDFTDGLQAAKVGPALSVISMGFSANDLGSAIATGDTAKGISSSLDLVAGGVGVFVPGAGLAWEGGKLIGTGIANGVEQVYDYQGGAVAEGAREMFGDNIDMNHLTVDQATELSDRYNGVGGFVTSISDSVNGTFHDAGNWLAAHL